MIVPPKISLFYDNCRSSLTTISSIMKETLFPYCERCNYAYKQRIKSLESLCEKIESGRYKTLDEIDDLVASTIIIATLEQESGVIEYINSVFSVETIKKRNTTRKAPDTFRFDSTRIICKLNNYKQSPEPIYNIPFEIQILTSFEHAWQITTHALAYKSSEIDWKVMRLSAQLRASIEQLDMLVSSFSVIKDNVTESEWLDISIMKQISRFVNTMVEHGNIYEEHLPKDLTRFSDTFYSMIKETTKNGKIYNIDYVNALLHEFETFMNSDKIPISITLLQYLTVFLLKRNKLQREPTNFCYLITTEVADLYPEIQSKLAQLKHIESLYDV